MALGLLVVAHLAGCGAESEDAGPPASDGAVDAFGDTATRPDAALETRPEATVDSATADALEAGADTADATDDAPDASDASADGPLDAPEDGAPFVTDPAFAKAWAHGVCDHYDRCCTAIGKTEDHAACEAAVEKWVALYADAAMARGSVVDPTKLADCAAALDAADDECTDASVRSDATLWRVEAACYSAMIGTKKVGESCNSALDCIPTPGTNTTCLTHSGPSGTTVSLCQQRILAELGDPCTFISDDPVVHVCNPSKELACSAGRCVKKPAAGEACFTAIYPQCDLADRCIGTTCSTRLDVGVPCAVDGDCKAGLRCDATKMCAPLAEIGEPCSTSTECASQTCTGGRCQLHYLFFAPGLTAACK